MHIPDGWIREGEAIRRDFTFPTFARAAAFVAEVGTIADEVDHHPEMLLRFPGVVSVRTTSHDTGTVTLRDAKLAARIDSVAANG